jgi:hypothetical protein
VRKVAQVSCGEFTTTLRYSYKKRTAVKFCETHCEYSFARSNPFGNGRRRRAAVSGACILCALFGTTHRIARRVLNRLTKFLCRSIRMMSRTELSNQFFPAVFHRGEMFIAWETAFRSRKQSCDLAAVGARAKQHGFTGRLLKELTLSYEQWFQQVVWRQGIITIQTMRNGRSRSHQPPVVVGTRCLRARPDDLPEHCPVARSLLGIQRSGVSILTIVAASTARELSSAGTSTVVRLVTYVPCT